MFLCGLGMASSFLSPSASLGSPPIGPLVKETAITKLEPEGTGCITGSVLVLWDLEGLLSNLWIEFEAFDLEDPRDTTQGWLRRKYCEILINLEYPERFGLTVTVTKMEGRAFVVPGVTASIVTRMVTEWQGPGDDGPRPVALAKIEAKGSWYGRFSEKGKLESESLVVPCGMKRPLVARITKSFSGEPETKEGSFIRLERPKTTSDVVFKLTWRHCDPPQQK